MQNTTSEEDLHSTRRSSCFEVLGSWEHRDARTCTKNQNIKSKDKRSRVLKRWQNVNKNLVCLALIFARNREIKHNNNDKYPDYDK